MFMSVGSGVGDVRRKWGDGYEGAGKWYFGDHSVTLFVLENQVVIGITLCSAFQLVIRQSRIHHENRFLCGGKAIGRWYRPWRRQSDQLADGWALGATKVDAADAGAVSGLYCRPLLSAI